MPDFYQGTELWDLNLVDPDNRRPVDFEKRRTYLQHIPERDRLETLSLINELLRTKEDGRIKLFLIYRGLKVRNEHAEVFQGGAYIPLEVAGKLKDHIIAFARNHGRKWAMTVVPRFLTTLIKDGEYPLGQKVWDDTHIPIPQGISGQWENVITSQFVKGESKLTIGEVLSHFPVALLMNEEEK